MSSIWKAPWGAWAPAALAVSLLSANSWAQPATSPSADQLFEDGRKAMTQGQFERAAQLLEASQKADPAAGTLLNLAECYEKLDKLATAVETYTQARDDARRTKRDKWAEQASERIAALTPRLPKVRLVGKLPKNVRFELDGRAFAIVPGVAAPVDPKTHRLVAFDGNRELQARTFTAKEAVTSEVTFDIPDTAPAAVPLPPTAKPEGPIPSTTAPPATSNGPSPLVWVLGGAGLASAAVGTVLLVVRNGQVKDATQLLSGKECPETSPNPPQQQAICDEAVRRERGMQMSIAPQSIAFAVGGAFAISAVALYFATKSDAPKNQARATCAPGIGGGACIVHF